MICSLWPVPDGPVKSIALQPGTSYFKVARKKPSLERWLSNDNIPNVEVEVDTYRVTPNRHGGHTLVLERYVKEFVEREKAFLVDEIAQATQSLNALIDRHSQMPKW